MKKIFLFISVCLAGFVAGAQTYESIKNEAILTQYKKAKEDLDKAMSNSKFTSKAEAYILKSYIYGTLSMDADNKEKPSGDQLADEGDAAFKKYKEMEPSMSLVNDPVYQNGPINLYSNYYSSGYADYDGKRWEASYGKLKKAVFYSDVLIEHKLLNVPIDTNVLILAGITAEKSNHKDDAALFYSRLADKKITGDGFESVYRFLVSYYFGKKDIGSFEKYKAIGAELYPKSDYFTFDKIDFAVGLQTSFDAKLKAVEEVLASDPNSFKGNEVLGEIIYDTLAPKDENAPLPSNAEELEKKMVIAFNKAAAAKPGYENPYLFLGDYFINKAVKVDNERTAFSTEMKARTKPGTPNSKEDIAKRDALDKKYADALELAREPYEKVADIFAARPNLEVKEKQQYKKAASYLADIYAFKKVMATKLKSPDAAKYAAEEKKWNDKWDSIK